MSTYKSFQDFVEGIRLSSKIVIGDLVSLDPEYKRYHYRRGEAPLFQWSIGFHGHITNGIIKSSDTAVVIDIRLYMVDGNVELRSYKLLVDNGMKGWFCEASTSLKKQN